MKSYLMLDAMKISFRLLYPYLRQQRLPYLALFLFMLLDMALTFGFAWLLGAITDAAVHSDLARMKGLLPIGVLFIVLSVAAAYGYEYVQAISVGAIKRDFKADLYRHLLLLPPGTYQKHPTGELLSHFTNDIHSIDGVIGMNLVNLIRFPLLLLGVFLYLFHISWELAMVSLSAAPVAMLAGIGFGLLLRNNSRKLHKLTGESHSLLTETFWGMPVIRSFLLEKRFFLRHQKQSRRLYSLELSNAKLRGWFQAGSDAMGSAVFLTSLLLGAYYVLQQRMTVGSLLSFVNLTGHLLYPLTGLAALWAGFQRAATAVERLAAVLQQQTVAPQLPEEQPAYGKAAAPSLELREISFGYDGAPPLFRQLSLRVPAGKAVAIVGPSGAGKTTLFQLLQGFYSPQSGAVLIDSKPVDRMEPAAVRAMFAYVSQDTYLFSGTIRDNLLLAREGITDSELLQAAKTAHIHGFIMSLPEGYDTEVGERGVRLSGGQKQRLAIARALLKQAPVLLLDEATSALDGETEQQVKLALDNAMKDRTTLIIAHRLSTIRDADWIVVLSEGGIVQEGTHDALIREPGLYRSLYVAQAQEQKGAAGRELSFDSSAV
jgi:ATP-binding cassette, subfamily B, bacterial